MRYMDKQIQSVYAKQNDVKIFLSFHPVISSIAKPSLPKILHVNFCQTSSHSVKCFLHIRKMRCQDRNLKVH